MSDIFTKLYLNIGKFTYPNQMQLEVEDMIMLEKALKRVIINPTLFLIATITFSRLRPQMLRGLKEFFYKNRPESVKQQLLKDMNEKLSQIDSQNKSARMFLSSNNSSSNNNQSNKSNNFEITNEYDFEKDNNPYNEGASALRINTSRKLKSRRDGKENEEDILKIPRKEPMFRDEYFGFGKGARAKVSRLLFFKKFLNRKVDRQNFNNKAVDFLLNSKFVYVPFLIYTILTIFDFGYTSFGLYLKYQPLIDTYYAMKFQSRI